MQRRTLLKLGSSALALGAVGAGAWVQLQRRPLRRESDTILGGWPLLGPGVNWLLPDLDRARVVIPDRPHDHAEDDDPARRALIKRTRSFHVSSSAARLRGPAFAPTPAEGVTRILAIGDSTTFGWGVAYEDSWPARLERELGERGQQVEVLNAGVPAMGITGMAAYLQNVAPSLGLHGVVFSCRPPPGDMVGAQTYRHTIARSKEILSGTRFLVAPPPVSRFDRGSRPRWRQEIQQLSAQLAEHTDTPVFGLTEPIRRAQQGRGCDLVERAGRLQVIRLESDEVLLDVPLAGRELPAEVYALFERDPTVVEPLIFDGGHLDAEGNRIAAALVAAELRRQGWW